MIFKPGKRFEVAHALKQVLGFCDVGVDIPAKFAIYDVSKLLGIVGLHDKDSVKFDLEDAVLVIKSKNMNTKYRLTDVTNVVGIPDVLTKLDMSNKQAEFKLTALELEQINSVSNSFGLPHVIFGKTDGDKLTIKFTNVKDNSCDQHDIQSESPATGNFDGQVFKAENLSMLMAGHNYTIITTPKFAHFESEDKKLEYFVAMEPKK